MHGRARIESGQKGESEGGNIGWRQKGAANKHLPRRQVVRMPMQLHLIKIQERQTRSIDHGSEAKKTWPEPSWPFQNKPS